MKREDFDEETYWVADCPSCGFLLEVYDHITNVDVIVCFNCGAEFEVED